jgi:hypothetical protein
MTVADRTEGHRAHCLPHLLRLRMLARDAQEAALPWLAAGEVTQAVGTILAEVEAEVRAVAGGGPGTGIFLGVRLSRLAAAADDAIAAASAGDFTQLCRHLRKFEALTSAIWTVQDAVPPSSGTVRLAVLRAAGFHSVSSGKRWPRCCSRRWRIAVLARTGAFGS